MSASLAKTHTISIAKYLLASATDAAESTSHVSLLVVLSLLLHLLLATLILVSLAIVVSIATATSVDMGVIVLVAINSLLSHSLLNAATSLAALVSAEPTSLVSLTT